MKGVFYFTALFSFTVNLFSQIYIAPIPDGSDSNPGTLEQPFGTFAKAISEAAAGDTIYVRGGVYNLTNTITITAVKSGSDSLMYTLKAYGREQPILDFSAQSFGSKGISLKANYWHIIGLQVKGAGDNGMEINFGSNNIIDRCQFYENRDTGLQLSYGSANNKILNCDSYYNADPTDYGDADGFAPKLTVGSGNYFYGCRAWGNCDDGWDGYLRGADDVTTTLENCWTWGNGYLKDGTDPGSQANGNGFKMGGGDNGNSELLMHHFIVINCVAFGNKGKGFDQNNNVGSMTLYNCTGYNNIVANYRIQRTLNPGQELLVKNCVSYAGAVQLGTFAVQETNSWLNSFDVTSEDFLSLVSDHADMLRQPDGNLPEIDFLHLAEGSDLIDAGVELGYAFNGEAPDLGAFESDYTTSLSFEEPQAVQNFNLFQNYPNPFNPVTQISYELTDAGVVTLHIYNLLGQLVDTIVNEWQRAGTHSYIWNAKNMPAGVYLYKLQAGARSTMKKMVLVK
jgi:hypothetical protein